ncbi:MAG: hypothetical protein JWQ38_2712 [Flavipsychrobacter sp.]|nr:hypothetical protein [Flavipsychrobacter sp.]
MAGIAVYKRVLNVAYGFYMLLGLAWVVMSAIFGHTFNYQALLATAMFGVQVYYKTKLVNLILGIILFFLSIYSLLDFLAMGGKSGFNGFVNVMAGLSFISIVMAGILIFSYLKLSFAENQ